jgi:hypothetical protein
MWRCTTARSLTNSSGQHVGGRVRRQRLSLERDRGALRASGLPYSCAGHLQALAVGSASECEPQQKQNRARVEHVFAAQQTALGGRIVRTIGIGRARAKIGLQNLAYNIRRLVTLERIAAA